MSKPADDTIVEHGQERIIAYAIRTNGTSPARDFLETEVDDRDLAALDRSFVAMARSGKIHNREKFQKLEGEIWEFKRYQVRIGAFHQGCVWYLTHGFKKKQDKWPRTQLSRAKAIMMEHLSRG